MDAARARLGLGKTKSWNQRLQDTTFTKLQSFVKLELKAMCECVEAFHLLNILNVCKLFSISLCLWTPARMCDSGWGGASLSSLV